MGEKRDETDRLLEHLIPGLRQNLLRDGHYHRSDGDRVPLQGIQRVHRSQQVAPADRKHVVHDVLDPLHVCADENLLSEVDPILRRIRPIFSRSLRLDYTVFAGAIIALTVEIPTSHIWRIHCDPVLTGLLKKL